MKEDTKQEKFFPIYKDLVFKDIFGLQEHHHFTESLLESLFGLEHGSLKGLKILNSVPLNKKTIHDKDFVLDILVELPNGKVIDLETYSEYNENHKRKDFIYITSSHLRQFNIEKKYDELQSIYKTILAKNHKIKNSSQNIQKFTLIEQGNHDNIALNDYMEIWKINLDNKKDLLDNMSEIEIWKSMIRAENPEEMQKIVPIMPILEEVLEELKRFSKEDFVIEWELHDALIRSEMTDAKKQGEETGKEIGKEIGEKKEKITIAKNMLQDNLDLNTIAKYTGMSIDELKALK